MRRHHAAESHNNLERWLLTYADMITLLTAFFLMLYSMSVMSKGKFNLIAMSVRSGFNGIANGGPHILNGGGAHTTHPGVLPDGQHQDYEEAMRSLNSYAAAQNLQGKVNVRTDERGVVISLLSDNMLFERGKATLSPKSDALLSRVAKILTAAPNNVQIEGHTCDLPINTPLFPSNWELSTGRAASVLRYFTQRSGLPGKRFTAAGYAETRPLAPNTSETNRARNRRVDIILLKTEPQQRAELLRQTEIDRIKARPAGAASPSPQP